MILHDFRPAPKPPIEIRAPDELLLGPSNCNMKTQWRHSAATLVSSSVKYEVFVSFNESFSYQKIFFQNSIYNVLETVPWINCRKRTSWHGIHP